MLKVVSATIVFADLNGFTGLADDMKSDEYIDFIYEFRRIIYREIKKYLNQSSLQYGFWGDEVKIILYSPDQIKNVTKAIHFSMALQKGWLASKYNPDNNKSRFKIGIATDKVTLGKFPGAVGNDIEGLSLCKARTLSKLAKQGSHSLIYLDEKSHGLVAKKYPPSFFYYNQSHTAYEIDLNHFTTAV